MVLMAIWILFCPVNYCLQGGVVSFFLQLQVVVADSSLLPWLHVFVDALCPFESSGRQLHTDCLSCCCKGRLPLRTALPSSTLRRQGVGHHCLDLSTLVGEKDVVRLQVVRQADGCPS